MKYLRKNKFTIIAILVLMVLVAVGMEVKEIFVPDEGKASYGNRLDGIKDHPLDKEKLANISGTIKENEKVIDINNYVHGKIINFVITLNDECSIDDAKIIANSLIPLFQDDELSFYSLQVYLKKEDANLNNFPIVGYKGVGRESLVFGKDREIVVEQNEE